MTHGLLTFRKMTPQNDTWHVDIQKNATYQDGTWHVDIQKNANNQKMWTCGHSERWHSAE